MLSDLPDKHLCTLFENFPLLFPSSDRLLMCSVKLGHDDNACKTLFKKHVFPKFFNPLTLIPFSLSSDKLRNELKIFERAKRELPYNTHLSRFPK